MTCFCSLNLLDEIHPKFKSPQEKIKKIKLQITEHEIIL